MATLLCLAATPAAFGLNFAVNQNAELQIGAPAGAWTSRTFHAAANMTYGMYRPNGVSVDASGSVYVSDTDSHRLMRFGVTPATDGAAMSNVLMKNDSSQASWYMRCSGGSDHPEQSVVVGDAGTTKLAVADRYNHRIAIFISEQTTDGPTGTIFLGQSNATSCSVNRGAAAPANNTLDAPSSVWTDGTKVAVADTGNNRVLLWDSWPVTGQAADHVLGQADFVSAGANRGGAATSTSMASPKGVWFDGTWLYVADSQNDRVLAFNGWPAANGIAATHVIGQPDFTTTTSACTNRKLSYPTAVTSTGSGAGHRLLITVEYQNRIVVLNAWPSAPASDPVYSTVLGQTALNACVENRGQVAAAADSLNAPGGMNFDGGGNLWVADVDNHRVLRFPSLATGTAADRVLGHPDFVSNVPMDATNGNKLPLALGNTAATADGARVAMAANGLLVATNSDDSSMSIWSTAPTADNQAFDLRYAQTARNRGGINGPGNTRSASTLQQPKGVWTDGTRMLVADTENDRVLVWATMPVSDTDAPDYVIGQPNFTSGTAATTQAGVDKPSDVASDGIDVFVADRANDRILIYRNFWLTPSNAKPADVVLGQLNFTSGASAIGQNRLHQPWGVTVDARRRLVVADQNNNRLLVWNDHTTVTNGQNADAVIGQPNFTSLGSGTISEDAADVQLAGGGLLWTQDCAVFALDPLPTSGSVMAATSEVGDGCAGQTVGQNRLESPSSVAAASGRVWVANSEHARLMRWVDATAPTITVAPAATVRCDGTVTISWTTSESTTTEIRWDTVTHASWVAGYANQHIDTSFTGPTHSYDLSFPTPGTKYVRVRAEDWNAQSVISGEISFVVPATCPAPTTMFGDDLNAQAGTGRANPSATNTPAINSTAFHTSWRNVAGVTMDRQEVSTWTTPPEHAGGVWHLDSSTAADPDGQTTNAITWSGGQPYATGRWGNGATFTAGTQYGTIADAPSIRKANDFTVDLWFSATTMAYDAFPILAIKSDLDCGNATDSCNYSIEFDRAANDVCGYYVNTANTLIGGCSDASTLLDGAFHHVALTVSSTNDLRLYVDGLPAVGPIASPLPAKTSTDPITLGRGGSFRFEGTLDEVRFAPVAYDAAAILGYYRARRPHAEELWTLPSTALAANCTTATRCEDQVYAGAPEILRQGARYWQRARYNTLTNDYWTDRAIDWFETTNTTSLNITVGGAISFGSTLPGQDAWGTSTVQVATNAAAGYQLLARDESDTWGMERLGGGAQPTLLDRQDGAVPPVGWAAGPPGAGFFGVTVRSATGNRMAKWGTGPGGFPENDVVNNLYTGLEGTSDVLLHERQVYGTGIDTVLVTWRANPSMSQPAGSYDGVMTLTAVANP